MKQLPINSTSDHPVTQGQLRMTQGDSAGEIGSTNQSRWAVRHPTSDFRNDDDFSEMEQVEYSERPYLPDEKWFA